MIGDKISQKNFREVAMTYLKSYQSKPKGRGRKSHVLGAENARYYHTGHLVIPVPDNKRRRCMGEACTSIV